MRERDLHAVMTETVSLASATLGLDRGIIWQLRPEHDDLIARATIGWSELPAGATLTLEGTAACATTSR